MNDPSSTTAMLLTPPGRGGIAVIALAGPGVDRILNEAFRPAAPKPETNALRLGHVVDADGIIDQAICARNGERAEVSIHGGSAAATAVLRRLAELGAEILTPDTAGAGGLDPAHAKWENPAVGREMLALLPGAASVAVAGALSRQWSAGVSELAANLLHGSNTHAKELRDAAGRYATMRRLLDPPEVVLAGPPNAGKSTLANALIGRVSSIVHDRAGTTRDWVREPALLVGLPVWLTDTAGLWQPPDFLDAEAVRRSAGRIAAADLVLLVGAGRIEPLPDWLAGDANAPPLLRVAAKTDVAAPPADADVAVCAPAGQGLDELARAILDAIGLGGFDPALPAAFTERQAALLTAAADALDADRAEDARNALRELLG